MKRRGFLATLIGGATLDPERLLWRPGAMISIPSRTLLFQRPAEPPPFIPAAIPEEWQGLSIRWVRSLDEVAPETVRYDVCGPWILAAPPDGTADA